MIRLVEARAYYQQAYRARLPLRIRPALKCTSIFSVAHEELERSDKPGSGSVILTTSLFSPAKVATLSTESKRLLPVRVRDARNFATANIGVVLVSRYGR